MKIFVSFLIILIVICPLYAFQSDSFLELAQAEKIIFVNEKEGKQIFEEGNIEANNTIKLNESAGVVFESSLTMEKLKERLNLKLIRRECIDDISILYGYTPYYSKTILIDGKSSNVQIVEKEGYVIVGLPIIYSGF